MEMYERHYNYDENIFREKGLVKDKELLKKNMSEKVKEEVSRVRAFVKLKVWDNKFLYARIEPKHAIEDLILKELIHNYPNFTIVISSHRGNFVMSKHDFPFPIKNGVYFTENDPFPVLNRLPTNESLSKFEHRQVYWNKMSRRRYYKIISREQQQRIRMRRASRVMPKPRLTPLTPIVLTTLMDFTL